MSDIKATLMGFFDKLKNIFRRKKKEPEKQEVVLEEPEIPIKTVEPPKPQKGVTEQRLADEKMCPKCGAPNDKFVNKCWLCKEAV